jgi:hypothetical protein
MSGSRDISGLYNSSTQHIKYATHRILEDLVELVRSVEFSTIVSEGMPASVPCSYKKKGCGVTCFVNIRCQE